MVVSPVIATVIAAFFAWRTAAGARGATDALGAWSVALVQFAVASACLAWGVAFGWSSGLYRGFYLFGAITNVGWLGLGTIMLLVRRPAARVAEIVVGAASAYAVFVAATSEFVAGAERALATRGIPAPSAVMGADVRFLSRAFSIGGSVVVLAGLVWSLFRRRGNAPGLALIAGGVVLVGTAGELARAGAVAPFSQLLTAGIVVMYLGFARTRSGSRTGDSVVG